MRYSIVLLIMISMVACKNRKNITAAVGAKDLSPKDVIIHDTYNLSKDNADFDIISATIKGDLLTMIVTYSGGCKEHLFAAHATKIYMKSMPPQLGLMIEHVNNDDNCRSIITDTLVFNLMPIRYPGNETDYTVIIRLPKLEEGIPYKY
jgi:hypothetical protein